MAERLAGKTVIITGGGRGQGKAEAELFAREGASVVVADVLDAEAAEAAQEIRGRGGRAASIHLDVSVPEEWTAAADFAAETFGGIDILVNNAGISKRVGIEETELSDWHRILEVNLTGPFSRDPRGRAVHAT